MRKRTQTNNKQNKNTINTRTIKAKTKEAHKQKQTKQTRTHALYVYTFHTVLHFELHLLFRLVGKLVFCLIAGLVRSQFILCRAEHVSLYRMSVALECGQGTL